MSLDPKLRQKIINLNVRQQSELEKSVQRYEKQLVRKMSTIEKEINYQKHAKETFKPLHSCSDILYRKPEDNIKGANDPTKIKAGRANIETESEKDGIVQKRILGKTDEQRVKNQNNVLTTEDRLQGNGDQANTDLEQTTAEFDKKIIENVTKDELKHKEKWNEVDSDRNTCTGETANGCKHSKDNSSSDLSGNSLPRNKNRLESNNLSSTENCNALLRQGKHKPARRLLVRESNQKSRRNLETISSSSGRDELKMKKGNKMGLSARTNVATRYENSYHQNKILQNPGDTTDTDASGSIVLKIRTKSECGFPSSTKGSDANTYERTLAKVWGRNEPGQSRAFKRNDNDKSSRTFIETESKPKLGPSTSSAIKGDKLSKIGRSKSDPTSPTSIEWGSGDTKLLPLRRRSTTIAESDPWTRLNEGIHFKNEGTTTRGDSTAPKKTSILTSKHFSQIKKEMFKKALHMDPNFERLPPISEVPSRPRSQSTATIPSRPRSKSSPAIPNYWKIREEQEKIPQDPTDDGGEGHVMDRKHSASDLWEIRRIYGLRKGKPSEEQTQKVVQKQRRKTLGELFDEVKNTRYLRGRAGET